MITDEKKEIDRIKEEYVRRDNSGELKIYSFENPAFAFHMKERERGILKMLRARKVNLSRCDVLEVGCGTGHILQRFLDFGAKTASGIDLMSNRIQEGKHSYPQVNLFEGNAAKLPFSASAFDLVMQFMCLSSVLDPTMRQEIANEMWRVLKPGGHVVFYDLRPAARMHGLFFKAIGLFRGIKRKIIPASSSAGKNVSPSRQETPIVFFDLREIKKMFPHGVFCFRSISLDFKLAGLAGKFYSLTYLLSCCPFLRTHYLVTIQKPI